MKEVLCSLSICSLASSSSGNCYVVLSGETAILVDAGISAKQICLGLAELGLEPQSLDAILVTHEHSDHIKGLEVIAKRSGAKVLTSTGTLKEIQKKSTLENAYGFEAGSQLQIGNIDVQSFSLSHDAADPVGYSFKSGGKKISIVTDTGIVTEGIRENMKGSDILVLESNHDENVLKVGAYPWFLKQRILGNCGHLSNDAASEALTQMLKEEKDETGELKDRMILLAHLSKENNFPQMATATMENALISAGFSAGKETHIAVLERTARSPLYQA